MPDAIFAADLWDVVRRKKGTHPDYLDPARFFAGTHPTDSLKQLVKDVTERLAGVEGHTPVYRLETGFGGGKTHALIACTHAAREGERLADRLGDYGVSKFPAPDAVSVCAFVGEESDPLSGNEHPADRRTRSRICGLCDRVALLFRMRSWSGDSRRPVRPVAPSENVAGASAGCAPRSSYPGVIGSRSCSYRYGSSLAQVSRSPFAFAARYACTNFLFA